MNIGLKAKKIITTAALTGMIAALCACSGGQSAENTAVTKKLLKHGTGGHRNENYRKH